MKEKWKFLGKSNTKLENFLRGLIEPNLKEGVVIKDIYFPRPKKFTDKNGLEKLGVKCAVFFEGGDCPSVDASIETKDLSTNSDTMVYKIVRTTMDYFENETCLFDYSWVPDSDLASESDKAKYLKCCGQ